MNDRRPFHRGGPPPVRAIDLGGRVPPNNSEAEAAVLSAVLCDAKALDTVLEFLEADHFYSDANRRVFEAAIELHAKGQPVDTQTVAAWLKDRERLQAVGGISYLAKLVDATPSVAHVAAHAKIVKEKARIRRLIETCQMVAASGYGDYGEAQEFIDQAEQKVYEIAHEKGESAGPVVAYDLMTSAFGRAEESIARIERGDVPLVSGVPTGFVDIDQKTTGMHPGELIIVAARPGMGKTSYVLDIAMNIGLTEVKLDESGATKDTQLGVMVFSLEMPKEQLADRMIASDARIDVQKVRKPWELQGKQWDDFVASTNRLSQMPVWVDDTPALSVLELRAKIRRKQAEFDKKTGPEPDARWVRRVGLVIVDYLQLMRGRGNTSSREQEIEQISRELKALAKELRVPVIALSQLNRECETRSGKDKRPILSDLRGSGAIEQDADVVQFIYRPEYYLLDKTSAEARKVKGYAEVVIAKQRNGSTGRVGMTFHDHCTRFETRARDAYREEGD